MYPVLHDSSELYFVRLDKGKLNECTRCVVHEELNGAYYLEMDYPIAGAAYQELTTGGTIEAVAPHYEPPDHAPNPRDQEYFDITKYSLPIDGVVTFTAEHVSRRLAGSTTPTISMTTENFQQTWAGAYPSTYNGLLIFQQNPSDYPVPAQGTYYVESPKSPLACLIGEENSFRSTFGGDFVFWSATQMFNVDSQVQLHVHWLTQRGSDKGAEVRFGVNLLNITHERDTTNIVNAYVPYWDDGQGNITYATGYLVQPTTPITPVISAPLDCSSVFEATPTSAQLVQYARDLLDSTAPWTPSETITVDFANGAEIYPNAQDIMLGDTVSVYWGEADVAVKLRVVSYDYDVLAERYTKLELGTQQTQFVAVTGESYAGASGGGRGNITTYTHVDQIGLTRGSATIVDVWNALPLGSLFYADQTEFASGQRPSGAGAIEIVKASNTSGTNRSRINRWGVYASHDDYRMFISSGTGAPSGVWEKLAFARNNYGSSVSLTSYTSSSNRYTFTSDGYVYVRNTTSQTGDLRIYDAAGSTYTRIGGASGAFSLFVFAGMSVYVNGTVAAATFFPFTT